MLCYIILYFMTVYCIVLYSIILSYSFILCYIVLRHSAGPSHRCRVTQAFTRSRSACSYTEWHSMLVVFATRLCLLARFAFARLGLLVRLYVCSVSCSFLYDLCVYVCIYIYIYICMYIHTYV